jgi:hypothetical protein
MVSLASSKHLLVHVTGALSWEGCEFNFRELQRLVHLVAAFMDSLLTDVSQFTLN